MLIAPLWLGVVECGLPPPPTAWDSLACSREAIEYDPSFVDGEANDGAFSLIVP